MNTYILGWVWMMIGSLADRHAAEVILYLQAENRALRELHGNRRVLLTDHQRRHIAAAGKILGRRLLEQYAMIVTPDTILRWHRQLIARKMGYVG